MFDRMRGYVAAAGRDPDQFGIHVQLSVTNGTPDDWRARVEAWRELGVTDISVNTMRGGLATPTQHLKAIERAAEVLLRP
jgi:alkanesulfonate monooxygenase SsuD/methylene tetrahydromethanopterin reductase-like flavin-dependent oxidoreductase (luciferase family)